MYIPIPLHFKNKRKEMYRFAIAPPIAIAQHNGNKTKVKIEHLFSNSR